MKRLERLSYYEVEAIVDSKPDELGNPLYLVKWKNWPPETNTWQPVKHLSTVRSLIKDFHNAQKAPSAQPAPSATINAQTAPAGEVVKRKRGRPRIIREPVLTDAKPHASVQPPGKAERLALIVEEKTRPVIEKISDEPPIKLEEVQSHKDSKKKHIRKLHRPTLRPLTLPFPQHRLHRNAELPRADEADEEKEGDDKQQLSVGEVGEQAKDSEQAGLQQVLLQCLNYTGVKVSFRGRAFYYQIPFVSEGRQQSVTVTASEIIKVNQRWFEGFFQGFYL